MMGAAGAAFFMVLAVAGVASAGSGQTLIRDSAGWTCNTTVDYDLVRITTPPGDALRIGPGCSGRIGRLEITGVVNGDGIKIQNPRGASSPAHDLVVEGGVVSCSGPSTDGTHQDGLQAMGGRDITFRNLVFDCYGGGGGNFFVQRAVGSFTPTNVVCEHCAIGPHHPNAINLGRSVSSGLRDSLICRPFSGRNPFMTDAGAQSPVNVGNLVAAGSDPRCANVETLLAWVAAGPPSEPEPEPEPEPGVCDQACVDEYEQEIAELRAELDAAGVNEAGLLAEIGRLEGLLAEIQELAEAA